MKLRLDRMCAILVLLSSILMLRADLFFVSIEIAHSNTIYYIVDIIGIALTLLVILSNYNFIKSKLSFSLKYAIVALTIFTLFFIYTMHLYKYSFTQTLSASYGYFYILYSIPIAYIFTHSEKQHFIDTFIKTNIFFLVVRSIAWVTYNYTKIHIFTNFATQFGNWSRNGVQRVTGGPLFGILAILIINNIFRYKGKNRRASIFQYSYLVLYSFFVSNSRYLTAVLLATLIATYFFTGKRTISKYGTFLFLFLISVALISAGVLDPIIETFHANGTYTGYAGSTQARLLGIQHFMMLLTTIGHNIGLGYIINAYTTEHYFAWTNWLNFYLSDFGIFEGIIRFGIFSIIIYGWLFLKAIKISRLNIQVNSDHKALAVATTTYMISICLLQDIYDVASGFQVPFFVGILTYLSIKPIQKRQEAIL